MKPDFLEHISLGLGKGMRFEFNDKTNTITDQINTLIVQRANAIDEEIFKQIHDIAIDNEIDDIYVINKEAVVSAFKKQIPKKPIDDRYPWCICPVCGGSVFLKNVQEDIQCQETTYCEHCGQALDWSDSK